MKELYSLDEIKKAFWEEFNECGEVWFNYLDSPEQNELSTIAKWESFTEQLKKVKG